MKHCIKTHKQQYMPQMHAQVARKLTIH